MASWRRLALTTKNSARSAFESIVEKAAGNRLLRCTKKSSAGGRFVAGRAAHDDQTLVIARLQPMRTKRLRAADAEMAAALD
jgi:hypothetical protein